MEMFLSFVRSIGLRHPFRPCKVSTLFRELTNRVHSIAQKEYADKRIKDTVGDKQTLLRLSKDVKQVYNGYTNYLRSVKLPVGSVSASHWSNIPSDCQESFAVGGAKRPVSSNQVDDELRESFIRYSEKGPFGSADPCLPLDFEDTLNMLSDDILCELNRF